MKNYLALIICTCIISSVFGQKISSDKVPSLVTAKFSTMYREIGVINWEKENGNYEANFSNNGLETSVIIDAKGNLVETETAFGFNSLPKPAQDYTSKYYPDVKATGIFKIVDAAGVISYEIEIGGKEILFDQKGIKK